MVKDNKKEIDATSLGIEGGVIALITAPILSFDVAWEMGWLFKLAVSITILLYLIRLASIRAEKPNKRALKVTLRWSCICIQFCIIGAVASAAVHIVDYHTMFRSPVVNFALLTTTGLVAAITIDEYFLGEYFDTWISTIYTQTGDNPIGDYLREAAELLEKELDFIRSPDTQTTSFGNSRRMLTLAVSFFVLFVLVSSPLWILGGRLIDSNFMAIVIFLMLWIIRDQTRYLYFNYGPADSFEDVNSPLSDSILVLLVAFIMATESVGLSVI